MWVHNMIQGLVCLRTACNRCTALCCCPLVCNTTCSCNAEREIGGTGKKQGSHYRCF